jgi:predicted RNA binding protein YcfA (HicA-like mRNA interferase family)
LRGSHHVFKHTGRPGHIVVPHPKKDLGTGLLAAIPQTSRPVGGN